MRPAGRIPATPGMFRDRCELFRDLICAGVPKHLIGRAVAARTTPAPEDGPDVVRRKLDLAARIGMPLSQASIDATYQKVANAIADDFERDRPTARAVQAARLQQDLVSIRSDIESEAETINGRRRVNTARRTSLYLAAHRHEELFARVVGTQAPTEIRLDATIEARRTLLAVVMGMSPEEQASAIAEEEERERLGEGDG